VKSTYFIISVWSHTYRKEIIIFIWYLLFYVGRRDAAIVSGIPGTTRDVIESCVNINGFPVVFVDTAGIRSFTVDQIEAEGVL